MKLIFIFNMSTQEKIHAIRKDVEKKNKNLEKVKVYKPETKEEAMNRLGS